MKTGSVVVDLAAEMGGNCELTKRNEVVDVNGVKIVGFDNLPVSYLKTQVHYLQKTYSTSFLLTLMVKLKN